MRLRFRICEEGSGLGPGEVFLLRNHRRTALMYEQFDYFGGEGHIDVSNRPQDGWSCITFAAPRRPEDWSVYSDARPEGLDPLVWCREGFKRAGIRYKPGGRLWWRRVT